MVVNSEIATSGFSFFEMMKENEIASSCFALLAKAERFCEAVVTKAVSWIQHHSLRLLRDAAHPSQKQ